MGFFNWSAPLFGHFADRWSDEDIRSVGRKLTSCLEGADATPWRILDVGGGTGAFARRLHNVLGAEVVVLDPTPEMLRYIPADGSVKCVQGVAEAMPFADGSFDIVVTTDAFHHFRDQAGAVREFARVVRVGGCVFVSELDPSGFVMRLVCKAERMLGEPGAFLTPPELCAFMAENGIDGECMPLRLASYEFMGTVKPHV